MAGGTGAGKERCGERPGWRGPRALGALVPGLVRPAFRKHHPATAQLLADWPSLVGPYLAAATFPRRLSNGVLTLGYAGPVAMELRHMPQQLIDRINGGLGRNLVESLRFVEVAMPAPPAAPPSPRRPGPVLAGLPSGGLRAALEALGAALANRPVI